MAKSKSGNFKGSKRKRITNKETSITKSADCSAETLQARRELCDIFKVLKGKKPTTKDPMPNKAISQNGRRDKEFLRQAETKSSSPLNQSYKKC